MSQIGLARRVKTMTENAMYGRYPNKKEIRLATDFMVKLRDQLLAKGYITSFTYHQTHSLELDFVKVEHFSRFTPSEHVSRAFAEIYECERHTVVSLFHPKQALPIHAVYLSIDQSWHFPQCGDFNGSEYADHYRSLDEILADHPADYYEADEEAQLALVKARRPGKDLPEFPVPKYNPVHARYLDLRGKTAETLHIDESPFSDNADILNGNLKLTLETSNHDSDVTEVVKDEEELAEDIELNRIADEREGQTRIRVDINDL